MSPGRVSPGVFQRGVFNLDKHLLTTEKGFDCQPCFLLKQDFYLHLLAMKMT